MVLVFTATLLAFSVSCGGPEVMPELRCKPQLVCPGAVSIEEDVLLVVDGTKAAYFECEGICQNGLHTWLFFAYTEGPRCDTDRDVWLKLVINGC